MLVCVCLCVRQGREGGNEGGREEKKLTVIGLFLCVLLIFCYARSPPFFLSCGQI